MRTWRYLVLGLLANIQILQNSFRETEANKQNYSNYLYGLEVYLDDICANSANLVYGSIEDLASNLELGSDSEYLEVQLDPILNRTVYTSKFYNRGEFICEYTGELISQEEVDRRLEIYSEFSYILQYTTLLLNETYSVDAQKEDGRLCRLINHSWKMPNVDVFPFIYRNKIRLIFLALRNIKPNEQLFFDYGFINMKDDEDDMVKYPWLNS